MGHRTQAECGQHKARDQELTSSVVLSPTTARERKGREGFVPSPNALSQAKDISWASPLGAMLPDRDIPARNPRGPSCSRPRAATPPRSGEPRAPPTNTQGYPAHPHRPASARGTPLGPDPHSGRWKAAAGVTPAAAAASGAPSALRHRGHVAVATAPRIPPARPGGGGHLLNIPATFFISLLKFSALPDHA